MNEILTGITQQERKEKRIKDAILALVFSKPFEQLCVYPAWSKCMHVDIKTDQLWPDLHNELPPMISSLVGALAQRNVTPIDVCIVRSHGLFSLVVKVAS